MGDLTAVNDVINGGWSGWVQSNADKVVTAYLPAPKTPTNTVTATSGGLVAPTPATTGKTIAGIPVATLAIAGVALLVGMYFLSKG